MLIVAAIVIKDFEETNAIVDGTETMFLQPACKSVLNNENIKIEIKWKKKTTSVKQMYLVDREKVTVTYEKVSGADGYEISCYENWDAIKKINIFWTNKTTKSFQCKTDGACCYVRVRAYIRRGK